MENLYDQRKVYDKNQLLESQIKNSPIEQFQTWFAEAQESPEVSEANGMAVSTVEEDGCPRTRMVLLKSYDGNGFIFYTNYDSRKGHAIEARPLACLSFFWPALERQIIIKAHIERIDENLSDEYFAVRPRGSQLGALVSPQSRAIPDREFLKQRMQELEQEYAGKEIQRPENWGGYIARPYEIEFWQGRPNRLHDRILYTLSAQSVWKISRLAP